MDYEVFNTSNRSESESGYDSGYDSEDAVMADDGTDFAWQCCKGPTDVDKDKTKLGPKLGKKAGKRANERHTSDYNEAEDAHSTCDQCGHKFCEKCVVGTIELD